MIIGIKELGKVEKWYFEPIMLVEIKMIKPFSLSLWM